MSGDRRHEHEASTGHAGGGLGASDRFALGRVVATPGALQAFEAAAEAPSQYVARHARGDWGLVDAHDAQANERALHEGTRVLSAYALRTGVRIWVITEADRSSTAVLLPDEY